MLVLTKVNSDSLISNLSEETPQFLSKTEKNLTIGGMFDLGRVEGLIKVLKGEIEEDKVDVSWKLYSSSKEVFFQIKCGSTYEKDVFVKNQKITQFLKDHKLVNFAFRKRK